MDLNKLIPELEEKARKATAPYVCSCGSNTSCEKVEMFQKELSPDTILTLIAALKESRELAEACDKVFGIVENVGRETFCHADFAPEHKKARAFLAKYFPKET